jgi:hypothetical protein
MYIGYLIFLLKYFFPHKNYNINNVHKSYYRNWLCTVHIDV